MTDEYPLVCKIIHAHLLDFYNTQVSGKPVRNQRGSINDTWFINNNLVLTIFKNRTVEQVSLIIEVIQKDSSGLMPKMVYGYQGFVSVIQESPCVLWERISGTHFVAEDHSKKVAISEIAHKDVANVFWRIQKSLTDCSFVSSKLGKMDYVAVMKDMQSSVNFQDLPIYLQKDFVADYLEASTLPLKYPALVHTDMERHNILHNTLGYVVGVVDADAIMLGDILFEYGHYLMNFIFTDPNYSPLYVEYYIKAMLSSGFILQHDIALLPSALRLFAAEDLLYYHKNDIARKTDLPTLAHVYQIALQRVDAYFSLI